MTSYIDKIMYLKSNLQHQRSKLSRGGTGHGAGEENKGMWLGGRCEEAERRKINLKPMP